jgi:hypothetical protein
MVASPLGAPESRSLNNQILGLPVFLSIYHGKFIKIFKTMYFNQQQSFITLITPIEPKKVSISVSVTLSGRPETNTLSSIVIRSSPTAPPAAPP